MAESDLTLRAGNAELIIAPSDGGSLHGLRIDGTELLRQDPGTGQFVMAPWAGRLGYGEFEVDGHTYHLPTNKPPHSIHGTARDGTWEVVAVSPTTATITHQLTDPWPFPGTVTQSFTLADDSLAMTMRITATEEPFPAQGGWHPWFLRDVPPAKGPLELSFDPAWQEERGPDYLPTGRHIPPTEPPWDDDFGMPDGARATLTWPGFLELTITSPVHDMVVWTLPEESLSVEPQSGPPNGLNTDPRIVTPTDPLDVRAEWRWRRN
ncbi:aldose epimerase family protein [Nocardia camponoti]|uniref:Aldose 1-epimerase n=1 Tax=Nocardia camponoti TaxID=1616106 RepID=A0A917QTA1_9NOCA|nr:aldose 1-epimerase [Nocardia camponoti]GGK67208.1 aldose 1-epimerase [Nocardia camponoti]